MTKLCCIEAWICLILKCIVAIEADFLAKPLENSKAENTSVVKNMHYLRIRLKSCLVSTSKENSKNYCRNIYKMKPSLLLTSFKFLCSKLFEIQSQQMWTLPTNTSSKCYLRIPCYIKTIL